MYIDYIGGITITSQERDIINPEELFKADGFTHAVATTGTKTIYLSGQLPWDKNFQVVGEGDLEKQTRKVFENLEFVLKEAGATWENVVKLVTYTTNPEDNEKIGAIKMEFLKGVPSPADTIIGVTALADPRCFVEIEAVAVL